MIMQKQIAEKAGVSYATVSRAFTHSAKVRPEKMKAIRDAMQELGIDYEEDMFSHSTVASRMVLVIVGDICMEFYAQIIDGISEVLNKHSYSLVLCNSKFDSNTELESLSHAQDTGYAGAIMITATETSDLVKFLQHSTLPVVLVNRYLRALDLDVVRIDNYRGGYIAAQHLIDKGHKKIAILSGQRTSSAVDDRIRGFSHACIDNHITFDDTHDVYNGDLTCESGKNFAHTLMEKDYSAVFITNNPMTVGVVQQLAKFGKHVPDDYSIVCFDDSAVVGPDGYNISSIGYEAKAMGTTAADVFLQRLREPLCRHTKTIFSPLFNDRYSVKDINLV